MRKLLVGLLLLVAAEASAQYSQPRACLLTGCTMTAPILGPAADNCTTPPYSFSGDATTGICSTAAGSLVVRTSGTNRFTVSATTVTSTLPILAPNGTLALPSHSFATQPSFGFFSLLTRTEPSIRLAIILGSS